MIYPNNGPYRSGRSPGTQRWLCVSGIGLMGHIANGQCADWLPGCYQQGIAAAASNANFGSCLWDPDGAGPDPELLIVVGPYGGAGEIGSNLGMVGGFDGLNWRGFGGGLSATWSSPSPYVQAAVIYQGRLVVGGRFNRSGPLGTTVTPYVAAWDGVAWSPLGAGTDETVKALVQFGGRLIVGGSFSSAGGQSAPGLAQWDGSQWSSMPGLTSGRISALVVMDQELYAGGNFVLANGGSAVTVARFDGSSWHDVGGGVSSPQPPTEPIRAMRDFNGQLVVAGSFATAGGNAAPGIARWDGVTWHGFGAGLGGGTPSCLGVYRGELYVGGNFQTAGGIAAPNIARWDGAAWHGLAGGATGAVNGLSEYRGEMYAWGELYSAGGQNVRNAARWNGSRWLPLGLGLARSESAAVQELLSTGERLFVFGAIGVGGGAAVCDGVTWSACGPGLTNSPGTGYVKCAVAHDGEVIAGGYFNRSGATILANVARWNGVDWQPMGSLPPTVAALCTYNQDVIAAGSFTSPGAGIVRWDGAAWLPLGAGLVGGSPVALHVHNGDLIVGGAFTTAGGQSARGLARWDGSTWHPIGSGLPSGTVNALTTYAGSLIAAGRFSAIGGVTASNIAGWDGTTWATLGQGLHGGVTPEVHALAVYEGRLFAGGFFANAGSVGAPNIAVWNGTDWASLGGTAGFPGYWPGVTTFQVHRGELIVGGAFTSVGGMEADLWARWSESGLPYFVTSPAPRSVAVGSSAVLDATRAWGFSVTHRWRRNGVPVADGPAGASPGGGVVRGAHSAQLSIDGVQLSDAGVYDCVISNDCGSTASAPAALTVTGMCYPNCDASTTPPVLNISDYSCFLNRFATGDPYANCDQSTVPPVLTVSDFSCFLNTFAAGCP